MACFVSERLTQALPRVASHNILFPCFPFLSPFRSPLPAVPASSKFTLGRVFSLSGNFWFVLLFNSLGWDKHRQAHSGKYTRVPLHTHTHALGKKKKKHSESPFVLSLTTLCTAAAFYWWLPTADSKVSLSFDLLICIGSLSQRDSVYQCPQAECHCLFSAYKYSPDIVCHVYSWTSLTFDNTLDIFTSEFHVAFSLTKYHYVRTNVSFWFKSNNLQTLGFYIKNGV